MCIGLVKVVLIRLSRIFGSGKPKMIKVSLQVEICYVIFTPLEDDLISTPNEPENVLPVAQPTEDITEPDPILDSADEHDFHQFWYELMSY